MSKIINGDVDRIKIKRKNTTGAPLLAQLEIGELCVVVPDNALYIKKNGREVLGPFTPNNQSGYIDLPLAVTVNNQTVFNIFTQPTKSNLFINDLVYFKDKSYQIQEISGAWKLIWLEEFELKTEDFIILRKI